MDLTVLAAVGFTALGLVVGVELGYRWAWLLHGPLPRPWRPERKDAVFSSLRAAWRYLAPLTVWRDVRRCWTTGRWT